MVVIAAQSSDLGNVEESNGRKNRIMRLQVIGMRKFKNKRNKNNCERKYSKRIFEWTWSMKILSIWYVDEFEAEILQIPSPWLTMTLQARLAWGASTNCLRPELNWIFKKLLNDNCIHVDPQNFLWVNIEIIDPLVPKDISRRGGLRSLPFSNRWVSVSQMTVERGGCEAKSAVYH